LQNRFAYLRQEFEYDGSPFKDALLVIHYDNIGEVYVNGERIWKCGSWIDAYVGFRVTDALKAAMKPGKNVIAVHCNAYEGEHFADVALLLD
jgi:hypothetical protein